MDWSEEVYEACLICGGPEGDQLQLDTCVWCNGTGLVEHLCDLGDNAPELIP
jgi:hypothetical protein